MHITHLLETHELTPPLDYAEARVWARQISDWSGLEVYPRSLAINQGALFCLGRDNQGKQLIILSIQAPISMTFEGEEHLVLDDLKLKRCPTSPANVQALHQALPFTKPRALGLVTSAGCGDRLGLATPGHIQAIQKPAKLVSLFAAQVTTERVGPPTPHVNSVETSLRRTPDGICQRIIEIQERGIAYLHSSTSSMSCW